MMAEVNRIVQEQEVQVTKIDQSAQDTEEQIRGGVDHTIKAVDKARAARRKKWICLGIVGESSSNGMNAIANSSSSGNHSCYRDCHCRLVLHGRARSKTEVNSVGIGLSLMRLIALPLSG